MFIMKKEKLLEVYKITNLVNGKVYVGITNQGYKKRWHKHCSDSYTRPAYPIHFALAKYGIENFKAEVLEKCSTIKSLKEREIYWIEFYKSTIKEKGYNVTKGGDGAFGRTVSEKTRKLISLKASQNAGKVVVYYEDTEKVVEYASIHEAAKELNLKVSGVRDRIYRGGIIKGTYVVQEKIKRARNRRVRTGFKQTEETKKKISESNKKHWAPEKKLKARNNVRARTIFQYDLKGKFIKEYISAAEAARAVNGQRENISKCARRERKKASGYRWEYKDTLEKEWDEFLNKEMRENPTFTVPKEDNFPGTGISPFELNLKENWHKPIF